MSMRTVRVFFLCLPWRERTPSAPVIAWPGLMFCHSSTCSFADFFSFSVLLFPYSHGRPQDCFQGWANNGSGDKIPPAGSRDAGAQPRLKSWGGPRFGSQHLGACARGHRRPLPLWGFGGIISGKFVKTQMLNPAFWWLLAVKFLTFWKLRPRSWGPIHCWSPNLKVGGPVSLGPYTVVAPMQRWSTLGSEGFAPEADDRLWK